MGFRLECKCANNENIDFYGTKLYGYYKGIDNFPSIKYLESIGAKIVLGLEDDETFESYFDYMSHTPELTLTHDQFLIFITLYSYDWNFTVDKKYFYNKDFENFLEDETIKKLIESNDDIIIYWC